MGTSGGPQDGSSLGGEGANGRWTDAHDVSRLFRAVVVEIEQDQSGPLTRGQLKQQVSNVFADVDLIEWIG